MAADAVRLGRDEARFECLYREYAGDVYRYALAIMRNPSDAEDVTQTTFLNAWRAYCAGEEPRTPLNWFIAIAHNVCRLRFRTNSRRPHEVEFEPALAESPTTETPDTSEVLDALAELPLNQRAALVMRELQGRSYAEIADVLGVTRSAVETLIFRARRSLRVRREAIGTLAVVPLPSSLASFVRTSVAAQTGAAAVGSAVAAKAVAVIAAGLVAAGAARETVLADTKAAPTRQAAVAVDRQVAAPATPTGSIPARETARVATPGRFAARPSAPVARTTAARPAARPATSPREETTPASPPATAAPPQAESTPVTAPTPRALDQPLRRLVPSIPVALPELPEPPELPALPAPALPPVSLPPVPAPPVPEPAVPVVPVATPELPSAPEIPAVEVPLPTLP